VADLPRICRRRSPVGDSILDHFVRRALTHSGAHQKSAPRCTALTLTRSDRHFRQTGQHTLWPYFVRILSPGFHAAFPLDTATQGHRCRFRVLRSSCGTALPAARCIGNLYRCDGSAGPAQRRGATIPSLVQTNQIGGHCVGHLPAHLTQKQAMVILIGVSSTSLRLRQILSWLGCSLSTPNTRVPLGAASSWK
jgi:hypothetical protein